MTVLEFENFSTWYNKNNLILENIYISLEPGYIYGLLGINGAGKTTLLNTLTGSNRSFTGSLKIEDIKITPNSNNDQWYKCKKKDI
ncbi:ATP-binding cassette domain-containing protein [Lysinibacillus contaminans]|uniref:ATP-binding cassette domain-containing protein n=1 Tax=Lysinibacillus contaminans TaxID=1293441 RepID=UPI000AF93D28|nr:ATP-binding cassette domain-containing protein [Lysinibacillus contaminans]